ncbi:MAG TPA: GDP-mannose 4,6-dehydratase [Gemmatimonadota bacterium]|nr:GDP-mannose 4,6-dehydratase [Gemmatimonadota bacterium]
MRVFITGIEGFVGRHLADLLRVAGHEVTGSALRGEDDEGVVAMDVRDQDQVHRVLGAARPEVVFHLAGEASVSASFDRPVEVYEVNAGGALHVLEACRRGGAGRVMMVTSCEVYGDLDPAAGPATETRSMAPISPYGGSKADQDLLGEQYARTFGLDVVRVRSFPHTGPGQAEPYLFPSVARRIAEAEAGQGPATVRVGNIDVVRDLLDVRDVARAYLLLMERGRAGEAYNVCGGRGRILRENLEELCGLARVPVRLEVDRSRLRPADTAWMVGDPSKLETETGWRPGIGWRETANDLLEDARARMAGVESRTGRGAAGG